MKQPIKMTPGDELHLTALMAPFSLNLVTGQDRQHLLGYGRAAFEAGKAGQCLHQIQEPTAAEQAAWHAGLDEGRAQAAPAAVAVPDGWKLVPVDPTEQMEQAAADYLGACVKAWGLWKAMITSAPECAALAATPAADAQDLDFVISPDALRTDDLILVPRGVLGSACHAISKKRDAPKTLAELRRYAFSYLPPAAAPVVLPQPVATLHCNDECYVWARASEAGQRMRFEQPIALFTEQQLRALLATATGLPAQAIAEKAAKYDHLLPYLCKTCGGYGLLDRRCQDDPLGSEPCPDCNAAPQAQADARDAAQEKPPAGRYVLAWMEGKEVPIRAMWVPKSWLAAGDECPEGWAEYDEDKDEYFCPEGWYEANEHEETHWHVGKPIIAWGELPRYAAIAAAKGK